MSKQYRKKTFEPTIDLKINRKKAYKRNTEFNINQLDDSARVHLPTSNLKQSNNLETREKTLLLAANQLCQTEGSRPCIN